MRRFLRKRRRPVVWLPNTGTAFGIGSSPRVPGVQENPSQIEFLDLSNATGTPRTIETPLVLDNPPEVETVGLTLAQIQANSLQRSEEKGYLLRRIVGKMFLSLTPADAQQSSGDSFFVKCGIIVRRVDGETGQSLGNAADTETTSLENNRDPWIWQRCFILSGFGNTGLDKRSYETFTTRSTFEVGGTKDGPELDIKTARRIGPEERLFLDVTWYQLPISATNDQINGAVMGLRFLFDYRCLGTLYTNAGNRRNASR